MDGIADPAGLAQWHPAERGFWHTGITPDVQIQQGGIPDYRLFNAAVNKIGDFRQRPGESKKACIARLQKLVRSASEFMDETFQESVQDEANSLYQEGVLNGLSQAEHKAMWTGIIGIGSIGVGLVAESATQFLMPWIGDPIAGGLRIGTVVVGNGYAIYEGYTGTSVSVPPQFLPEQALLKAMQARLFSAAIKAANRCKCQSK